MKFPIPEGMVPPDGVTEGSTFDALATLRLEPESMISLVAIDGLTIDGGMKEEAPETEAEAAAAAAEEMGFDEAIRSGMMEG
jgi:hypothetical protein